MTQLRPIKHSAPHSNNGFWQTGTSGFRAPRGPVGFCRTSAALLSQVICTKARSQRPEGGLIFIGYDTREGSRKTARQIAEIALASGLKAVISPDFISTPEFTHFVRSQCSTDISPIIRGILVTGSHSPSEDNGICIIMSDGTIASKELSAEIVADLNQSSNPGFYCDFNGNAHVETADMHTPYFEYITTHPLFASANGDGIKVSIDPMRGTGARPLRRILASAGYTVRVINDQERIRPSDRQPYPRAGSLRQLEQSVHGLFIDWNMLFPLFIDYLLQKGAVAGNVACTHTTTRALEMMAPKAGFRVFRTAVGFRHVSRAMLENNCFAGLEGNGGAVFSLFGLNKDGILINFLLANIVADWVRSHRTTILPFGLATDGDADRFALVDSADNIVRNMIGEVMLKYAIPQSFGFMREVCLPLDSAGKLEAAAMRLNSKPLAYLPANWKVQEIIAVDEHTKAIILKNGSWFIVRRSGTEKGIRIYAEAPTTMIRDKLLQRIQTTLTKIS